MSLWERLTAAMISRRFRGWSAAPRGFQWRSLQRKFAAGRRSHRKPHDLLPTTSRIATRYNRNPATIVPATVNDNQLLRYSRHILLDEFGVDAQEKLLAAHALIVGAGGLGSPVALYLAAAGVGTLSIADADT